MKKLDIFLLKATPYFGGIVYLIGVSLLAKYDLIGDSFFFFITGIPASLVLIAYTFATDGSFSRYRGQGLVTIRFLFFIQLLFFIALTIINITSLHIFEPKLTLILNGIGYLIFAIYIGYAINSRINEYIQKYYR